MKSGYNQRYFLLLTAIASDQADRFHNVWPMLTNMITKNRYTSVDAEFFGEGTEGKGHFPVAAWPIYGLSGLAPYFIRSCSPV